MRRTTPIDPSLLEALLNFGDQALPFEEKLGLLVGIRENAESSRQLDHLLLEQLALKNQGLREAQAFHQKLQSILARFNEPPWHPATFLRCVSFPQGVRALVHHGHAPRLVALAEELDPGSFRVGQEVYLGRDLNLIIAASPEELRPIGETCHFQRKLSLQRILVKSRDEEMVAEAPPALLGASLRPGDPLLWNREARLVYERVERSEVSPFFLEETPRETFEDVGGLGSQIAEIQRSVLLHLTHADVVAKYRLRRVKSILMEGPPGTGKTLLAKALANWLAQLVPAGRSLFMNIKPGALHSVWFSQSEANYREVFQIARDAAARQPGAPVVMFFDELDSVGAARGGSYMRVHDNVTMALVAELDGLQDRGDILVIGATNRRESLDPALDRPGRMGDLILQVPRPNPRAAREILSKHLPRDIPYARNGHGDDWAATRSEIIDTAVSRIYSPNGEGQLATLVFRDGKRQPVGPSDLVNGAVLANVTRRAIERACVREVETGQSGVEMADLVQAIEEEFLAAGRVLTPQNCRQHLPGLPQDMDVVRVEPVVRRVRRPQRYLQEA
jgi:proteasome-associated ATPase